MTVVTKEQMLETKYVIDNDYLDKYVELINLHLDSPKVPRKTHAHHIIPVSYFTSRHIEVNNSSSNLVNLFYKDHMLAHLYLSGCTQGRDRYKNLYSVFQLSHFDKEGYLDIQNYERYQQLYEEAIDAAPNHRKGTKCSDETRARMRAASKLRVQQHGGAYNKDTTWVNDANVEKMITSEELDSYLNNGFSLGRIYRHDSEVLARISEAGRRRIITDEFREKMRIVGKLSNVNRDPESYKKQGRSLHEYYETHRNPFKGKHHTPESIEKNRLAHLGRVRIAKEGSFKNVRPEDVDKYLSNGWKVAVNKEYQPLTDMIFITNGVENKKIHLSDLAEWEGKGYGRGVTQHRK